MHVPTLLHAVFPQFERWLPQRDAGADLRRAAVDRRVEIVGDNPDTCLVRLVRPELTCYLDPPCVPIAAWMAAWRVDHSSCRDRELAIRQDIRQFRAGLQVLIWLAARGEELLSKG